ncbi:MAG: redoxin domain-containing protein [Candidatus Rokubacteria bacterium]|nr:redoxin domain-containing protein [Candidatus Rokubacteria bacterium]
MIPQLRGWHERYTSRGLTIIGVHTPEFFWEKPADKVADARQRLGIPYPVLQDNDHTVWKRYGVWAWPTLVLVDKRGVVRYRHVGEGAYADTEAMITTLLAESG